MKGKKILITGALVGSLMLVGYGIETKTVNNLQGNKNIEQKEDVVTLHYDITKEILEVTEKNTQIFYPQIKDDSGGLLTDYGNQSLKRTVDIYASQDAYRDVHMGYEVTKMDENILSVVFKGTGKVGDDDGNIKIQHSINLDMASSLNEITYDNFIKDDEISQKEVKKILDDIAKKKGITGGIQAEGMRLYFKGDHVIFYYMPLDDGIKEFVELSVPVEALEGYIHTDLGEASAS
ncbi:hypothetical protein QBE52_18170 [Clostridiaceae bacterium 35-E11]